MCLDRGVGRLMTFVGILPDKSVECSWKMPKKGF